MRAVVEEPECPPTARRVVDDLCHHRAVILKEELITYTDLSCRLYKHVPQAELGIELTQQEHLYLGISLFLFAVETRGKYLSIVKHEHVVLIEIIEDIAEIKIYGITVFIFHLLTILVLLGHLDLAALAMNNHQTALVTMIGRFEGYLILW
jgi:hypothetical protein